LASIFIYFKTVLQLCEPKIGFVPPKNVSLGALAESDQRSTK